VLQLVHDLLGGTVLAAVALVHLTLVMGWVVMRMCRRIGRRLLVALGLGVLLVHATHLHQPLATQGLQDLLGVGIVLHGRQDILAGQGEKLRIAHGPHIRRASVTGKN